MPMARSPFAQVISWWWQRVSPPKEKPPGSSGHKHSALLFIDSQSIRPLKARGKEFMLIYEKQLGARGSGSLGEEKKNFSVLACVLQSE
jgi:hypothetical protein